MDFCRHGLAPFKVATVKLCVCNLDPRARAANTETAIRWLTFGYWHGFNMRGNTIKG